MRVLYFKSSSSDKDHKVTINDAGGVVCTCRGFRSPSRCWHFNRTSTAVDVYGERGFSPADVGAYRDDAEPTAPAATPLYDAAVAGMAARGAHVAEFVAPMLASPLECAASEIEKAFPRSEWFMEEKFDGHRVVVSVTQGKAVTAWSRPRAAVGGGKTAPVVRTLPAHVAAYAIQLPTGTYDGELLVPGGKSHNVTELASEKKLVLVLFDVLRVDGEDMTCRGTRERRVTLEALGQVFIANGVDAVRVAPAMPVSSAMVNDIWARGGEGAILKRYDARYEAGRRSKSWIKVKKFESATLTIVGFEAGKLGPHAKVVLRDDRGFFTTVKTKDAWWRAAFAQSPAAYIGRKLRIEHQGFHVNKYRSPMFDHLVD